MSEVLKANITKRINVTDAEWKGLMDIMHPLKIKKREFLLKAGDVCEFNAFIVKGCLRTFFTDDKGHEHIFQIGFEDWWASDLSSFVTGEPANYSIEALEDCELLQMHRDDYDKLFLNYPVYERFFRILTQRAYVAGQQRMIDSMSYNAERRYLELVKKYPNMEMRVAQHHIASYLGITPEALSRIKRGIIEKSRSNS
ncbi:MAG: Crp/Fnr family transcriptional regulator [Flavobacteriales bacterium]|nr:Crp/Fnr family transcriptional regulator [Flavobacteriales bacterium]